MEVLWPRKGTGLGKIIITKPGSGYVAAPEVSFETVGGAGGAATAVLEDGKVVRADITAAGSGYCGTTYVGFSISPSGGIATAEGYALIGEPVSLLTSEIEPWRPGRTVVDSPYSQRSQVVDRSGGAWQGTVTIPQTKDASVAQAVENMLSALTGDGAWCEIPIYREGFANHGTNRTAGTDPGYVGLEIDSRGNTPDARPDVPPNAVLLAAQDVERGDRRGRVLVKAPHIGDWVRISNRLFQVVGVGVSSVRDRWRDWVKFAPDLPSDIGAGDLVEPPRTVRARLMSVQSASARGTPAPFWGPWSLRWIEYIAPRLLDADETPIPQYDLQDITLAVGSQANIPLKDVWAVGSGNSLSFQRETSSHGVGLSIAGDVLQVRALYPTKAAVTVSALSSAGRRARQTFVVQVTPRDGQSLPEVVKDLPPVHLRVGETTTRDARIAFGDDDDLLRYEATAEIPGFASVRAVGSGIVIRAKEPGSTVGIIVARNEAGPATYRLPIVVARITDDATATTGGPVYGESPSAPFPTDALTLPYSQIGEERSTLTETLSDHFHSPEQLALTYSVVETTALGANDSPLILPEGDLVGNILTVGAPLYPTSAPRTNLRTVEVKARDSKGRTITGSFGITLQAAANLPPVWRLRPPAAELTEDQTTARYILTGYCVDPDNDAITFTVKSKPSASVATVAINGAVMTVTRISTTNQSGNIVVTATDAGGSNTGVDSDPIPVNVAADGVAAPPAPTIRNFSPPTLRVGETETYNVAAVVTNNVPGQTVADLTWDAWTTSPGKLAVSISPAGVMSLTPSEESSAPVEILVRATATKDGAAASSTSSAVRIISPRPNQAPRWKASFGRIDLVAGAGSSRYTLSQQVDDADGDPVEFSVSANRPANNAAGNAIMSYNYASGGTSLDITPLAAGTTYLPLTARATRGNRSRVRHTLTVVVSAAPAPEQPAVVPTTNAIPTYHLTAGEIRTITDLSRFWPDNNRGDSPEWGSASKSVSPAGVVSVTTGETITLHAAAVKVQKTARVTVEQYYPEGRGSASITFNVVVTPLADEQPRWGTIPDISVVKGAAERTVVLPNFVTYTNKANLTYAMWLSAQHFSSSINLVKGGPSFGHVSFDFSGSSVRTGRVRVNVRVTDTTDRTKTDTTAFYINVSAAGSGDDSPDNEDGEPGDGGSGGGD